jgi:fluoride exporter
MPMTIGAVGALLAGGIAGVFSRYFVALAVFTALGGWLPWGTLVVNLTGCFLIGLFDRAIVAKGWGGPHGRMLLITGFCGAYTTFSSMILELDDLLRAEPVRGLIYVVLSVLAGLALFRAGSALGA